MSPALRAAAVFAAALAAPAALAQHAVTPVAPPPFEVSALDPADDADRPVALFVTAHPDDEDNALGALLRWKHGVRVVLWTMTRGEGGQNEIGLEQGEALKLLRDAELEAAHRFDGFEQFFPARRGLRSAVLEYPDFGYSFSVGETMAKWAPERPGRGVCREVLQRVRPHVVVTMSPEGDGGGQHHQTSAQLMIEECALERNPWRDDGRYDDGSEWHRPVKVYCADPSNWTPPGASRPASRPTSGPTASRPVETVNVDVAVDHWGRGSTRTYRELAAEARSMHKSQGMSRTLEPIGPATRRYRLLIDRTGLGDAATRPERPVMPFGNVAGLVYDVADRFDAPLFRGVRESLGRARPSKDLLVGRDFAPRCAAYADRDRVVVGEPLRVSVEVVSAGNWLGPVVVESATLLVNGASSAVEVADSRPAAEVEGFRRFALTGVVPASVAESPTIAEPFAVRVVLRSGEQRTERTLRVLHRSAGDVLSGEQRDPVVVVPPWDVRIEPPLLVVPRGAVGEEYSIPIRVHVKRNAQTPAGGMVGVRGPGVRVALDAMRFAPLAFDEEFVATGRAYVVGDAPGPLRAVLVEDFAGADPATRPIPTTELTWRRVIDYPHIERRLLTMPATAEVRVVDLALPPKATRVGYVRGVGEESEKWLTQLGVDVTPLDADTLAFGDLDRFDVIVIGARAYEFRTDLVAHRRRLRARVERGATLICQYQKTGLDVPDFAPYKAKIGSGRVTDEDGPVDLLVPDHPVFTTPNRIGFDDWPGWTRDRSLYHLDLAASEPDRFVDLLRPFDTFGSNAGPRPGALVEARVGRGRWIYCALALWRQLPEGVPGAWRLWSNLLSLRPD
jgi:LmbE family N-acetylglucosaminyl deacetylase